MTKVNQKVKQKTHVEVNIHLDEKKRKKKARRKQKKQKQELNNHVQTNLLLDAINRRPVIHTEDQRNKNGLADNLAIVKLLNDLNTSMIRRNEVSQGELSKVKKESHETQTPQLEFGEIQTQTEAQPEVEQVEETTTEQELSDDIIDKVEQWLREQYESKKAVKGTKLRALYYSITGTFPSPNINSNTLISRILGNSNFIQMTLPFVEGQQVIDAENISRLEEAMEKGTVSKRKKQEGGGAIDDEEF